MQINLKSFIHYSTSKTKHYHQHETETTKNNATYTMQTFEKKN